MPPTIFPEGLNSQAEPRLKARARPLIRRVFDAG